MIISNGTTDLTFSGTMFNDFTPILKSTRTSAGGKKKTQTAGKRFAATELIRDTESNIYALQNLLTDNSSYYYYTPSTTPSYLSSSDFPMTVSITVSKIGQSGGGGKKFHCELLIEGSDLL